MSNKTKNTKELERKAKRNELLSAFQLYQNYTHGLDYVVRDNALSQQYLTQCINYLENKEPNLDNKFRPKNRLTLQTLELFDFRRFKHLSMTFESDLTVIIGNNGQGKTTILNAISKTLSWVNANMLKADGSGQRLSELYDIKRDSDRFYADILAGFSFGKGLKSFSSRLSRSKLGTPTRRDSDIKSLKDFANLFRVINGEQVINLPLCAYYSVERSHSFSRSGKDSISMREERFDAYNYALVGAGKFEHFVEWFISLHKKAENDKSTEIRDLKQQVIDLKSSVENGVVSLKPILKKAQDQLDEAVSKLELATENQTLTDAQRKVIVVDAICSIIPSISDIWVETDSGADIALVKNDSVDIKIEQLSDGQRVFLGLVSDLVRRLIMLNPKLDNPLEGQGIVLIDEIELHLHPKWQQDVLLDLQKTFPNIQFIVTTHSPLVLSTVDKNSIRIFSGVDSKGNAIVEAPDFQTKGIINSDVLEQLMGTFAKPQRIEETHWLDQFETLLADKEYDNNLKAQNLYNDIRKHFGDDSFELKKCNSQIRIQKMKLKAQEKIRLQGGAE